MRWWCHLFPYEENQSLSFNVEKAAASAWSASGLSWIWPSEGWDSNCNCNCATYIYSVFKIEALQPWPGPKHLAMAAWIASTPVTAVTFLILWHELEHKMATTTFLRASLQASCQRWRNFFCFFFTKLQIRKNLEQKSVNVSGVIFSFDRV